MTTERGVPAGKIQEVFLITPKTLEYMTLNNFVVPGVSNPGGSGRYRLYSLVNIFEIALLLQLRDHGWKLPAAKALLDTARLLMATYRTKVSEPLLKTVLATTDPYDPFTAHSIPRQVQYCLDIIYRSPVRYVGFHLIYEGRSYGPSSPYGVT